MCTYVMHGSLGQPDWITQAVPRSVYPFWHGSRLRSKNRRYSRVNNGSQAVTHDPLTHTKTDPWPIIHDPWAMTHQINNATTHFIPRSKSSNLNRQVFDSRASYTNTKYSSLKIRNLRSKTNKVNFFTLQRILIYLLQPIVANNESFLNYMLPVNMQVGHGWKCIDPWPTWPIQKTEPFDLLTHDPSTHCLLYATVGGLSDVAICPYV